MSLSAEILGAGEVTRMLKSAARNVQYATAQAINDTALDVQRNTTDTLLPGKFTLRGRGTKWFKPGQRFGVNIRFARKDNLEATVGSAADWLRLHETGGAKTAGAHRVAIPTPFHKPKTEIMRREMKPRALLNSVRDLESKRANVKAALATGGWRTRAQKAERHAAKGELKRINRELRDARRAQKAAAGQGNKVFLATMKSGAQGIFRRMGPGRLPIRLLFSFQKLARIEPALHFFEASKALVGAKYDAHFRRRLTAALADAR